MPRTTEQLAPKPRAIRVVDGVNGKSRLSAAQQARLAKRLKAVRQRIQSSSGSGLPRVEADPEHRYDPFPLNDIQQAYLVGRSGAVELGNIGCYSYTEIEFEHLDAKRFEAALQKMIERHELLRCIVLPEGRQRILPSAPAYRVQVNDLRSGPEAGRNERIDAIREQMAHRTLIPDVWPLFEFQISHLDERRSRLHIGIDLLIADGRSFEILFSELMALYEDPELALPALDLTFRDYITALGRLEHGTVFQSHKKYWLDRLSTLPPSPELPLAKSPASVSVPVFRRRSTRIEAETWRMLKDKAKGFDATPAGILLAAYAEVLSAWSKNPRFTLNLTLFNRLPLHPQSNDIVGDFTSVVLFEVDNAKPGTFAERVGRQREQLWQDLDHRYYSGIQLMRELTRQQCAGLKAIMPVVFTSLLNLDDSGTQSTWAYRCGKPVHAITQTPQVYLDFIVQEDDGALVLIWDAVEEIFPAGLLDDMFGALRRLVNDLASDESCWSRTLFDNSSRLLPKAQKEERSKANATEAPISDDLLHTAFLERVAERPDRLAVSTPKRKLSYGELYARASRVEDELLQRGVGPNQLVGVLMAKGWEQVVAVLGIHFAGGAYLPINSELPADRQRYLIENGGVQVVLTQSHLDVAAAIPSGVDVLYADQLEPGDPKPLKPRRRQKPDDLAYVIYTSGSTGQPKGVMIDHRGALNTVLDINQRFSVGPEDRVLALSRLNFDLSVYDVFGLLSAGGAIVMPAAELAQDVVHWSWLIDSEKVTLWNTVPALMQLLADEAAHSPTTGQSLRCILMSGDWIPLTLPDQIRRLFPGADIISLGGATEASIWSILYPIETIDPGWKSVPYGKAMLNQTFHVLNPQLGPCPVWVPGQLYIGGIGVAKGYWRDEKKTRSSFIRHPGTGELLYRTGDLGRFLPGGNIEFLGREDSQVKVQGHRIELGEIEAHLHEHDSVASCVVAVNENKHREKYLVGYVVPEPGAPQDPAPLRKFLRTKLPEYMVPAAFVFLKKIPLTANGKVDRKALPAPVSASRAPADSAQRPSNALQTQLTELWESILGVHPVGPHDSFFDLGGNSIMTLRLYAELRRKFNAGITLPDLFRAPSVAQMAKILCNAGWTSQPVAVNHHRGHIGHLLAGLWLFIRNAWM